MITCPHCGRRTRRWRVIDGSPAKGTDSKACDDCARTIINHTPRP